jgi:hypothetical protein
MAPRRGASSQQLQLTEALESPRRDDQVVNNVDLEHLARSGNPPREFCVIVTWHK